MIGLLAPRVRRRAEPEAGRGPGRDAEEAEALRMDRAPRRA